jgi:bleomycin hydrolase
MKKITLYASIFTILISQGLNAQVRTNKKDSEYQFTVLKEIGNTEVKNQGNTGTCWSFSSLSFLESEIERMGKGKVNLSEMFIARKAYEMKADKYVRMMGKTNFSQGGAFHDAFNVIREYGLMPDAWYTGFAYGQDEHQHSEMEEVMTGMLNSMLKMKDGKMNPGWKKAMNGVLDAYLGALPTESMVEGKKMTPKAYAASLGINADDYLEISSFTHHPFYKPFVLEVPDNWAWNMVYNVQLDEMEQIVDNALNNGYTVAWASDVSEPGFSHRNGLAIIPDQDWSNVTKEQKDAAFKKPVAQKLITQEIRQQGFDDLSTQDDHGMHIVGMVKDQNGTKYYIVKNSWGTDNNDCGGYFYCSASYLRAKTTCVLVNKNSIPKAISSKLGI